MDAKRADPALPGGSGEEVLRLKVGEFEGPLDLLLHLVRANEVEITDIPIVEITRQYLEYLDLMRGLNLEVAGEYLVMASTLMHIKSQVLLPQEPLPGEEEAPDPRAELARQLLEHQRFQQAAENLQAIDSVRHLIWTRDGEAEGFEGEELLVVDLFGLISAFRKLLGRLGEEARLQLRRERVSVAEKIAWLTDLLERRTSIDLLELLASLATKQDRIAVFLAVLEMSRLRLLVAFQRELFGDIRVALRGDEPPAPGDVRTEADAPSPRDGAADAESDGR